MTEGFPGLVTLGHTVESCAVKAFAASVTTVTRMYSTVTSHSWRPVAAVVDLFDATIIESWLSSV